MRGLNVARGRFVVYMFFPGSAVVGRQLTLVSRSRTVDPSKILDESWRLPEVWIHQDGYKLRVLLGQLAARTTENWCSSDGKSVGFQAHCETSRIGGPFWHQISISGTRCHI